MSSIPVRSCTLHEVRRSQPKRHPEMADLGRRLAAQFAELAERPLADKCDYLLRNLADARTAVTRLRTRLEKSA